MPYKPLFSSPTTENTGGGGGYKPLFAGKPAQKPADKKTVILQKGKNILEALKKQPPQMDSNNPFSGPISFQNQPKPQNNILNLNLNAPTANSTPIMTPQDNNAVQKAKNLQADIKKKTPMTFNVGENLNFKQQNQAQNTINQSTQKAENDQQLKDNNQTQLSDIPFFDQLKAGRNKISNAVKPVTKYLANPTHEELKQKYLAKGFSEDQANKKASLENMFNTVMSVDFAGPMKDVAKEGVEKAAKELFERVKNTDLGDEIIKFGAKNIKNLVEKAKGISLDEFMKQFEYTGRKNRYDILKQQDKNGVFTSPDKELTKNFGNVLHTVHIGDLKIFDASTPQKNAELKTLLKSLPGKTELEKMRNSGYDGIKWDYNDNGTIETQLFKDMPTLPENISLEDIWNYANKLENNIEPNTFSSVGDILKNRESVQGAGPIEPTAPITPEGTPATGQKNRKFLEAVKTSPESMQPLKDEMAKRDITYQPISNLETVKRAQARVKASPEEAKRFVESTDAPSAETTATAIELIRHHQKTGDFEAAADIADTVAEKLTRAGQTIQAAKLYEHLSPESVLVKAQKIIRESNKNKWIWQKTLKLDNETAQKLSELAVQMKQATNSTVKTELAQEIQGTLSSLKRVTAANKIATAQTIAQLLNPKTNVRNVLGNEIFYRLERLNKYIATPIDWAKSELTGSERRVTFRSVKQGKYWNNLLTGMKAGWKGTSPNPTQFDLRTPAFSGKWNPMTYLEKTMGATLQGFDYAAYMRAKNETIGELAYLKALNKGLRGKEATNAAKEFAQNIDDNLLQIADNYGKYVTFQDDTLLSKGMSQVKKALNLGQGFGLGDLVLKYPKTPSSILMRAIEYSPAGFLRSAYLIAEPILKGRGLKSIDQREVELAVSRAITGSLGFSGLGYYLADKGIITGKGDDNKKIQGLNRDIGGGKYQINFSALKRWVLSGFKDTSIQKGDTLYSYDWAQPVAISLSLGANMNENVQKNVSKEGKQGLFAGVPGTIASSATGALETITDQPLLSGLRSLFGGNSAVQSVESVLEDLPSSFTPTMLNQMRQINDNTSRETYDPSSLQRAINKAKNKIPGLEKSLPARYSTMGKEQNNFENNSGFNVFLNPGFVSTFNPTPAAQMVLDIYNNIGETKQLPKVAPRSLNLFNKKFELTGDQIQILQKRIGKSTDIIFEKLASNSDFSSKSDSDKADVLNYVLTKIYNKERLNILTKEQKKYLIQNIDEKQKKQLLSDLTK